MIPRLCPFLGIFQIEGGMKSDEDAHGSVGAVSGALRPPGEEERKIEPFHSVECNPTLAFCHKRCCRGLKNRKN